ncbi:hypothetical protein HDU88_001047 [Geranomyces variabilis]|nr:hypothetical protein HDU88_001047 [Geranomyces variabilis]
MKPASKFSGRAMGQVFSNSDEEKAHQMVLATATDFYNMVRYQPNACLPAHGAERKYIWWSKSHRFSNW